MKELELTSFAGDPVYIADGAGGQTRVIPLEGSPWVIRSERLLGVVIAAVPGGRSKTMSHYDEYYLDRRGEQPFPVLLCD